VSPLQSRLTHPYFPKNAPYERAVRALEHLAGLCYDVAKPKKELKAHDSRVLPWTPGNMDMRIGTQRI